MGMYHDVCLLGPSMLDTDHHDLDPLTLTMTSQGQIFKIAGNALKCVNFVPMTKIIQFSSTKILFLAIIGNLPKKF